VSHVVSSEVVVTDLGLLKRAVATFPELEWREGQTKYEWVGRWYRDYHKEDAAYKRGIDPKDYGRCVHAIHMNGVRFEVGVCKRNDGTGYSLVWDFVSDGRKLSDYIGKNAEKLMCEYSRLYCENYALSAGFISNTTEDEEYFRVEMNQV
jgi:hypothetical protein